jgi:hypothetical protein
MEIDRKILRNRLMNSKSEIALYQPNNTGEIILYQPDNALKLEVWLENETVWLNRQQMALLFDRDVKTIGKHINNALKEELQGFSTIANSATVQMESEIPTIANFATVQMEREFPVVAKFATTGVEDELSVVANFATTAADGKTYQVSYYNLDVILSVGYRVKSKRGILFRQWANRVLKDFLLKGYAVTQRIERLEHKMVEHDQKFDLLIKTSLPPKEGIFFDGQIFDAYIFVADLIKSAKKSIILIDNYVDETVLLLLSKRQKNIDAKIYTKQILQPLQLDLQKHNSQYEPITIYESNRFHDRFLIVDTTVYHIGSSLKDLGKKLFAFSKMEMKRTDILK